MTTVGSVGSNNARAGLLVISVFSLENAFLVSSVHVNLLSFLSRARSGSPQQHTVEQTLSRRR